MMRNIVLLSLLSVSFRLYAQPRHIVIFDREDACYVDSANPCERSIESEKIFFTAYKEAVAKGIAQKVNIKLETPPLTWAKKVNDKTYGKLAHQSTYTAGFVTDLSMYNMLPNHSYRLCLNGRPDLDGNNLLPLPVRGNEKEKYYDVLTVTTDEKGEYHASLAIILKPGQYHVRFYVKDTDDFKIVLYHDYFRFLVK